VLADRGLPGAVAELADRAALPVTYAADLPGRLPESVETAAYFVLSEAIANAVKHSGAPAIDVDVHVAADTLHLAITDEGHGGANAAHGSGLAGLGDRVAAVGGRLTLTSPLGGPTIITAEIPCR
jgi:signal transduction histidine kinase